jgi:hypothetical protein
VSGEAYDIDAPELVALANLLDPAECRAIVAAAQRGVRRWNDELTYGEALIDNVAELADALAERFGIDAQALIETLDALDAPLLEALYLAAEWYWVSYIRAAAEARNEWALLAGTGLVRCGAGHSLAPPRDDCPECVMARLRSN